MTDVQRLCAQTGRGGSRGSDRFGGCSEDFGCVNCCAAVLATTSVDEFGGDGCDESLGKEVSPSWTTFAT